MMPEILAQVTYVVASVATRYDVIAVTETVTIAAAQVTSQHHYWVLPTEDHNNPTVYRLPLNDSTYNTRQDWIAYRERFNFLQPTEIKAARQELGLTLREAAFILGMGFSTLSNVENNLALQSFDHEVRLRYLTHPTWLKHLVRQHHAFIVARAARRQVDVKRLLAKLR